MKFDVNFDTSPLLVIWEVTRSCELACRHCRADAIHRRHPNELNTDEAKGLLNDIQAMGTPIVVFTGGDPLQREDLYELIRYAKSIGLRVGVIPAATQRLTKDVVQAIKDAGADQMALSLDGSTAKEHDDFRQVPGSFDIVMQGCAWAREVGIPLQINTVFGEWNWRNFDAIAELVAAQNIVFWEVFFLVPTGRGVALQSCSPEQCEWLFSKMYDMSQTSDFVIKVTEGPHYRRYSARQNKAAHLGSIPPGHPGGHPGRGIKRGLTVTKVGVNSGKGFCFVDHVGKIYPSGFLPIEAGDVRESSIIDIYRNHPLFNELRDTANLKGYCGRCKYKDMCGGSRARAYALTGDYLAEDPCCGFGRPVTSHRS